MVGAILVQNTAWGNVEQAINNLKGAGALNPKRLREIPVRHLERLLVPSGYFHIKARRLKSFIHYFWERYSGRVQAMAARPLEELRAELLGVKGIGPETADSILCYALEKPVFVVDAYTRRILHRHRILPARHATYEVMQNFITAHLAGDPALYNEYHALLVRIGKLFCRRRPRCESCPLRPDLGGGSPAPG